MKILKVIVDELPVNLQMCPMRQAVSNSPYFVEVLCALKTGAFTLRYDQSINRCPDCPLALADELMERHDEAFSELAKGAE